MKVLTIVLLLVCLCGLLFLPITSRGQSNSTLSDTERAELEAYRAEIPDLVKRASSASGQKTSYDEYLSRFYKQATEFRELRLQIYRWQLLAANLILGIIAVASIAGILMSFYQIYTAVKLGKVEGSTSIDMSVNRIQVTNTTSGIIIFFLSMLSLFVFMHDVFQVRTIESKEAPAADK
jgi:ABC-type multidrug transport system fused ATPase/permease subunit